MFVKKKSGKQTFFFKNLDSDFRVSILILIFQICKKGNELFHFGKRKYNIIHCQIRNSATYLMADLYNQCLSDTPMCENCIDSAEDAHHYSFTCSKCINLRDALCQTIQNIFIVTISLILIYYSMVVPIMDLILILKYLKQYIYI